MGTATLTLAFFLLAAGAAPDVSPINQSNFRIPIRIDPARRPAMKELILFSSSDEGKTWKQAAVASPDQDAFPFYATIDGVYWFSVCVVDQQGNREPADIYKVPPSTKILVDTLKPVVRISAADRQGDDIVVNWEIQEDHPDLATLKLEYRTADSPSYLWYNAQLTPTLIGQARFRLTSSGPVSVRLQMQDLAGNQAQATQEIAAAAVPGPAAVNAGKVGPDTNVAVPPSTSLAGSAWENNRPAAQPVSLVHNEPRVPAEPAHQPVASGYQTPSPAAYQTPPPSAPAYQPPAPSTTPYQPPATASDVPNRLVASSENPGNFQAEGTGPGTSKPHGGAVPPLQIVNTRQVSLEYEVARVGPSGIGKVDLWVTQDEGRTWRWLAEDSDLTPPITVELPGEGLYGFSIVVQSKAGLGKRGPVAGDTPEMRLEVDLTPPVAQLYAPELDPRRRDALMIAWKATDRNLAPNPITLQWAERRDGSWSSIGTDLPNTGRHSWQLPPNLPFRVYLRLIARDTAGNSSVAETSEPVLVDLNEPEARLIGVAGTARKQ